MAMTLDASTKLAQTKTIGFDPCCEYQEIRHFSYPRTAFLINEQRTLPSTSCNHWRIQHSFDVVPFKQRSSQREAWFLATPVCWKETSADNRTSRACQYL